MDARRRRIVAGWIVVWAASCVSRFDSVGPGIPSGKPAAEWHHTARSRRVRRPSAAAPPRYVQVVDNADPPPSQGQVWREYDLRPHLTRVRGMENPQRAVIDWILRETGTDRWIGDTPGMISFEGDKLRVYHVPEVQDTVAQVIDRFVNPELSKVFGLGPLDHRREHRLARDGVALDGIGAG